MDWTDQLLQQLTWHWDAQVRPGLEGLTDAEYLWEPGPGAWSIRPRGEARTPMAAGGGDLVADILLPPPDPAPITTIAWRLGHVIVGVFGMRNASHFGGKPFAYDTFEWAATAEEAVAQLDDVYATWIEGVGRLDGAALEAPCGPAEGPYADHPMAGLVLHIHREAIHHLAEVSLLRDLYRVQH